MIPLRDNIPSRTTPLVNWIVIGICGLVFLQQVQEDPNLPGMVERYGMIPARIQSPDSPVEIPVAMEQQRTPRGIEFRTITRKAVPPAVPPVLTMLTCVFLHGSWLHILGNMWFLYIFGDNVEDRFGHLGYALFYLTCGVAASVVHYISDPSSPVPTIGASGAIAGVMGAYFIWYPKAHVQTLVPIFVFIQILVLPAPLFLGIWFLIQFVNGAMMGAGTASGVAWWAHIGGFAAGVAIALLMGRAHLLRPRNDQRLRGTEQLGLYQR